MHDKNQISKTMIKEKKITFDNKDGKILIKCNKEQPISDLSDVS